jgi:hypothetical protein
MVNVTLNETKAPKAKPPSKTVVKKAEQVKVDREKQAKKDAKEKAKREKGQVVTDKKEEARAKRVHAELDKEAKASKKTAPNASKGGKPAKGKTAQAATPAKPTSKPAKASSSNGVVRTGVKVDGPSMKGEEFASIAKFYLAIKKPLDAGFQKLRKEVKASGKGALKTDKGEYKLTAL